MIRLGLLGIASVFLIDLFTRIPEKTSESKDDQPESLEERVKTNLALYGSFGKKSFLNLLDSMAGEYKNVMDQDKPKPDGTLPELPRIHHDFIFTFKDAVHWLVWDSCWAIITKFNTYYIPFRHHLLMGHYNEKIGNFFTGIKDFFVPPPPEEPLPAEEYQALLKELDEIKQLENENYDDWAKQTAEREGLFSRPAYSTSPWKLLPEPFPDHLQKVTLVVPLEYILTGWPGMPRLGLEYFLLKLGPHAEIVIVGSSPSKLQELMGTLDKFNLTTFHIPHNLWRRTGNWCNQVYKGWRDLRRLNRSLSKVIVLNIGPNLEYPLHPENVLTLNDEFHDDTNDTDLLDIVPVLLQLIEDSKAGKDLREIIPKYQDIDPARLTRKRQGRPVTHIKFPNDNS